MAVDDAAALLMGLGQAAPLGGAGGLLVAPPAAVVAHPAALFTDVARQLADAATVLQAATTDNGLAEFDAVAALSHRPLQSWVASRRVDVDPEGARTIDVTFKANAELPTPPASAFPGGSPTRAANMTLPIRWLRIRSSILPVSSLDITYGIVGSRPSPFSEAVVDRVRQLSASCTASRAPWLPSGLIAPPCEESVVVRTSVVYHTALVNKLTVSTADPASIQAVLVYLLHVAAYSQCCEGVSSTRYDRFYQSVATSAAPVTSFCVRRFVHHCCCV